MVGAAGAAVGAAAVLVQAASASARAQPTALIRTALSFWDDLRGRMCDLSSIARTDVRSLKEVRPSGPGRFVARPDPRFQILRTGISLVTSPPVLILLVARIQVSSSGEAPAVN